jgi:hypothetical protein
MTGRAAALQSSAMNEEVRTGVVCQWCERVIREGGQSLELVTCLSCAQTFGATFRRAGRPIRRTATGGAKMLISSR